MVKIIIKLHLNTFGLIKFINLYIWILQNNLIPKIINKIYYLFT